MKQTLLCIALVLFAIETQAQDHETKPSPWAIGLHAGWNNTSISRYDASRMDESYSAIGGIGAGLQIRYTVNDWLALRANPEYMQRSHRMDRNLNYLSPVYTEHINSYLMLPVMADFTFGGQRLRGHLLTGAYAGYWLNDRRRGTTYWMTDYYVYFEPFDEMRAFTSEDQRFNAGLTWGAGLSYGVGTHCEVGLDVRYYYDLVSHHKGYANLSDPRYLNTLSFSLYILFKK